MLNRLEEAGIRLREFHWEDLPAFVAVRNRSFPDMPQTLASVEHFERTYPPDNPRFRYAVETAQGAYIGSGHCDVPFWLDAPGVYRFYALVDPDWRRRGIGQALLAHLEQYARAQGAARLISDCRENMADSLHFLERAGFRQFGLRFESMLDLTAFDEARFVGAIDRVLEAGYELTTLAAERQLNPGADRDLFEIELAVEPDVPWPGGLKAHLSFDDFRRITLDGPASDPAAIFIAKREGIYAGYTALSFRSPGIGYTGMTGVRREHRGQGIALALKLLSFRVLKERGCTATWTHNDTANQAILALNQKLGYQKHPGILLWSKLLTPEHEVHS